MTNRLILLNMNSFLSVEQEYNFPKVLRVMSKFSVCRLLNKYNSSNIITSLKIETPHFEFTPLRMEQFKTHFLPVRYVGCHQLLTHIGKKYSQLRVQTYLCNT